MNDESQEQCLDTHQQLVDELFWLLWRTWEDPETLHTCILLQPRTSHCPGQCEWDWRSRATPFLEHKPGQHEISESVGWYLESGTLWCGDLHWEYIWNTRTCDLDLWQHHSPEELNIVSVPLDTVEMLLGKIKLKTTKQFNIVSRLNQSWLYLAILNISTNTTFWGEEMIDDQYIATYQDITEEDMSTCLTTWQHNNDITELEMRISL